MEDEEIRFNFFGGALVFVFPDRRRDGGGHSGVLPYKAKTFEYLLMLFSFPSGEWNAKIVFTSYSSFLLFNVIIGTLPYHADYVLLCRYLPS